MPKDAPLRALLAFALRHRASFVLASLAAFLLWVFEEISDTFEAPTGDRPPVPSVDRAILLFQARHRQPWLNGIAVDLTALGSSTVLALVTLLTVAVLVFAHRRRDALEMAVASFGAAGLTLALKHVIGRPRPDLVPKLVHVSGLSYPSGHSLGSTAIYATIAWLVARGAHGFARVATLAFAALLILAIADSRIYIGVHYPTDVAGGVVVGIAWLAALEAALRWIRSTRRAPRREAGDHDVVGSRPDA